MVEDKLLGLWRDALSIDYFSVFDNSMDCMQVLQSVLEGDGKTFIILESARQISSHKLWGHGENGVGYFEFQKLLGVKIV
jgi:hypothetical protein